MMIKSRDISPGIQQMNINEYDFRSTSIMQRAKLYNQMGRLQLKHKYPTAGAQGNMDQPRAVSPTSAEDYVTSVDSKPASARYE